METITINVDRRDIKGKGAARSLRRNDMIPAVIYRGGESMPIKIPKTEITKFINTTAGEQVMVKLQFSDGENKFALMKDYQVDPVKRNLLHADFFEVSLTEKVKVSVHVTTVGEPIGVKRDGGVLQHVLREIEVECLPDKIPGHIEVDISNLGIGQSFHVSDIKIDEEIRILTDPDGVIANVVAPVIEEVAKPAEEVAAAETTAEPEVIKKGKKEEAEEEK
ncbi:MAG: 50S ribosomal protein L25 [Nitrospirae bacterium]|jgi:large subunit ribosomal protein L25|nr:50S ribosomal protein L25 [Nitrospirota bacterium]